MRKIRNWIAAAAAAFGAYAFASQMAAGDVTKDGTLAGWHGLHGKTIVVGTVTLDGANPTPIDLSANFSSIEWAMVTFEASAAPGLDPALVTHVISGTDVNVYAWKVTGAGDTTLVASTNNTDEVAFIAVGTPL